MFKYYSLFVLLMACTFSRLSAQEKTKQPEQAKIVDISNTSGWVNTMYIAPGIGVCETGGKGKLGADMGFREGYRLNHFYINAGAGIYYLHDVKVADNAGVFSSITTVDQYRLILEVPVGIGVYTQSDKFIWQAGIDMPYLFDFSDNTNDIAIAPNMSFNWANKHNEALGFSLRVMIASQKPLSEGTTGAYQPVFVGLGFHMTSF